MSECLEVAAGALAVIGVADVAVRTEREVYGFLCSITLKESLETAKRRKQSYYTDGMVTTLDASLRGFNRELQSLKVLSAWLRGTNKNWSRVRYVLDERKIAKALANIERSTTLLGNALLIASRYRLISLMHPLLIQYNEDSSRRVQAKVLSRQKSMARTSTCIYRRTTEISEKLAETQNNIKDEHRKTRDILCTQIEDIISAQFEFQGNGEVSSRHIACLQSEFDNLVASAAQEEAASHPQSTATPRTVGYLRGNTGRTRNAQETMAPLTFKSSNSTNQTFSHNTPFGNLRVHLPRPANTPTGERASNEVGFSFTCGIGRSLNEFILTYIYEHYDKLFASARIEEFAAEHTRTDLIDYLESQGIGVSNLNHEISIVAGLFKRSILDSDRPEFEASVDYALDKIYDPSSFLFEMTTSMLLWDYYKGRPRSLVKNNLDRLQNETLIQHSLALDDSPWDRLGRNRIQRCYSTLPYEDEIGPSDPRAAEEISNALTYAGIRIYHRDHDGLTPSLYARRYGHWEQWCATLERNGLCIEDVLREE
ncbi:hypothetical protein EJ02DRAFT_505351 [Clathrospora elynae]|uniref:Uncharacterized protein n=1 Tax=Clathrospora elynae TaxID=706981 RepID=A0A6A5SF89_9PLEO|nr:hypothetical protein EJ02DRAFT_505351 [Clathrospora elynae]